MSIDELTKYLKEFNLKDDFYKEPNGMKFKFWLKKNPEIEKAINDLYLENQHFDTLYQLFYYLVNDIPLKRYCRVCGKLLPVKRLQKLSNYCFKCAAHDEEYQNKRKKTIQSDPDFYKKRNEKTKITSLKRYGVESPNKLESVKKKIKEALKTSEAWLNKGKKARQTYLEKYGVENISQLKSIKEKKKETLASKYNGDLKAAYKDIIDKTKKSILDKYGVDNIHKLAEFNQTTMNKSWISINRIWKDYIVPAFNENEWKGFRFKGEPKYKWTCVKCGQEFEQNIYHTHFMNEGHRLLRFLPRCPHCYPFVGGVSAEEKQLLEYIQSIYKGTIIENTKDIISPYELDIYLPEITVAFEFNGDYWHQEGVNKPVGYHEMKSQLCEEQGIVLFHVWENEWRTNRAKVEEDIKDFFLISKSHL